MYSSPSFLACLSTLLSFGTDCTFYLFLFGYGHQLLQYKADINAVNEHGNVPLHYACFWGQDQVAEVSTQALNSGMGGKKFELEWETLEPSTHPVSTVLCTTFTRFCTASALMLSWECPYHSHLLIPGPCGEWGPCQHL